METKIIIFQFKKASVLLFILGFLVFFNTHQSIASSKEEFLNQAYHFAKQQKYNKAFRILSKGLLKFPKDVDLYYMRAKMSHAKGDYDQAINDYSMTILLNHRKYPKAFQHRAECYYHKGLYVLVINDTTKCIKLMPKYCKPYLLRGKAYAHLGRVTLAIRDIKRAVKLQPKYKRYAQDILNKIYTGRHDF